MHWLISQPPDSITSWNYLVQGEVGAEEAGEIETEEEE